MTNFTEEVLKSFISEFCNDHNEKIRFLRNAFIDEEDQIQQILKFLEQALIKQREQIKKGVYKWEPYAITNHVELMFEGILKLLSEKGGK